MNNAGPDYRSALRLVRAHMDGHWARLAAAAVLAICSAMFEIILASLVWQALAAIIERTEPAPVDTGRIIGALAFFALISVIAQQVFFGLSTAVSHLVAFDVLATIRKRLGSTWVATPVGRLSQQHSASAKTLAIDHCERLEVFIAHAVPETTASVAVWIVVTIWLFTVNPWLTLATIALIPVAFYTMLRAMRANGHRMGEWVAATGEMNAAIMDFLTALPVVRTFNRIGDSHERTATAVRRNAQLQSDWGRAFAPWGSPFSTLVVSGLVLITPIGIWLYQAGSVDGTELALFFVLGPIYSLPLVKIFYRMTALPLLASGAQEIAAALADADQKEADYAPAEDLTPEIKFENVSFAYEPGHEVLKDISFTIPAGTTTALVGHSGSGKSTLAELLLRFHSPASGTISIGGRDVDTLSDADLYRNIAAVFQRPMLQAGSIRANLTLAKPEASEQECSAALNAAELQQVIAELPDGLDTQLGESGDGLSGGQKQRLAIARALLADRPIVILDEPTAATDAETELMLQRSMSTLLSGTTNLIIAHRLRTIVNADQIIVLEQGKIAERGTHDELVASGGIYAHMWADHTAAGDVALRGTKEQA